MLQRGGYAPGERPQLLALLDDMVAEGIASADSFILCVDDGSRDGTWGAYRPPPRQTTASKA